VTGPGAGAGLLQGLPPVLGPDPRVLILGSFPGAVSLARAHYYAHPRNQFWPILGALLDEPLVALSYPERLARLIDRRIALWDVLGACRRAGSLDTAIRDAARNDFDALLALAPTLRAVAFNGATAARAQPWFAARGLATYPLPSTSPAHAALGPDAKRERWQALRADGWIA
jgi:hypoxanthine-DNA glycosylase